MINPKRVAAVGAVVLAVAIAVFFFSPKPDESQQNRPAADDSTIPAPGSLPRQSAAINKASLPKPSESREALWLKPPVEPAFASFANWVQRYSALPANEKQAMLPEGRALAQARLVAMAEMIQSNPRHALELAVPSSVRQALPESIRPLVEETVNTRGDYQVMGVLPLPGNDSTLPSMVRSARVGNQINLVSTYGAALDYLCRTNVPLNGIAISGAQLPTPLPNSLGLNPTHLMALDPCPVRRLDETERTSRFPAAADAMEIGGESVPFASASLAEEWAADQTASANLTSVQYDAGTAASSWTEGRKRFLLMRVDFPNYQSDGGLTTNRALEVMSGMSNLLWQMSYGKFVVAGVGDGSAITPLMRMPTNSSYYDNQGLSRLYPDARTAAQNNYGINVDQFDILFVCTGGTPSYSYAGLGWVGGGGFHLANGYWNPDTSCHEYGHNLGLGHANWWNSTSTVGPGKSDEYGDDYDLMGAHTTSHYSCYFKQQINWITAADTLQITNSGRYRLHAQDVALAPIGVRAIKISRPNISGPGGSFWLEFRQGHSSKWFQNGISFRANNNLLDMTPGSSGGKSDHHLLIGRTFTDIQNNLHVTPVARAHTYPEAVDLVVNFGPFVTNQAPTLFVSSSASSASTGQTITFTASASDPNMDELAYSFDYGDGDFSVENTPVVTHSYSAAGEYRVECTVSDMKGGITRESVIVKIGSPSNYQISGHVLTTTGQGIKGIKVSASGSLYSFTESDGSYTIANIPAGSYTLNAIEPVYGLSRLEHPSFSDPLTVGPSFTNADFISVSSNFVLNTSLVSKGSSWKYLDNGSDPGTIWTNLTFDDSSWSNGMAILGYGEDNETTVIGYGGVDTNKYISYYFRQTFVASNLSTLTNFVLEVKRDDGVIVYLNGNEIFRDNMPAGTANYLTRAVNSVEPTGYLTINVPARFLIEGTNIITAEVHQIDPGSSDINFDLGLSGMITATADTLRVVYLSAPANNQIFTTPTNITASITARSALSTASKVSLYMDDVRIAETTNTPFNLVCTNPAAGSHTLKAVGIFGTTSITSSPISISLVVPAPPANPPVALSLIPTNSIWSWFFTNTGAAYNWQTAAFNDSSWPKGKAKLGFASSTNGFNTVLYGGSSSARYTAAYFRKSFIVNDPSAITNITLTLYRDDGAVVYLNGAEILRDNMTNGTTVTYTSLCTNCSDNGNTPLFYTIPTGRLVNGTNWITAEIHQSSITSSDLAFDLGLNALAATNRPRGVWLTSPAPGINTMIPATVTLTAEAVATTNLGITRIEFYAGTTKVGEKTNAPYNYVWTNLVSGDYIITAVSVETGGARMTSAPVQITFTAPSPSSALVSFGDVWRYLDDGTNQGTNWVNRSFDDRGWLQGAGLFGFGNGNETTTVSFGADPNAKFVTTYFRKAFVVSNPGDFTSVLGRLIRDDAAVVYINGIECFRNNLSTVPVSFTSLGLLSIDGTDETTPLEFTIPSSMLVTGTNIIAVEVHQSSITSSDMSFDLELNGLLSAGFNQNIYIVTPAQNNHYNLPAKVAVTSQASTGADAVTRVEYYAGSSKLGQSFTPPYALTWTNNAAGAFLLTARAILNSGSTVTSAPVLITISEAPPVIYPVRDTLICAMTNWYYWDQNAAVGANWNQANFDDSAWLNGPARLGYGYDGERTLLTEGLITYYFRHSFIVANPALYTELLFRLVRDDGAVVYLNGREIFRSNMPTGTVASNTLAFSTVNTPDETTFFETVIVSAGSGLVAGTNVIAVEIHQSSATSSDAGFDLELIGTGTTEPRVLLVNPGNNAQFSLSDTVSLEAIPWVGSNTSVSSVEFYVDQLKLSDVLQFPYTFAWSNLPPRTHQLTARVLDARGRTFISDPVNITVQLALIKNTFIASNAAWKYLDNGSNQGTNWAQPGFNDSTWSNGVAKFGYGGDGEVTTNRYGSDTANKYITYYYRRTFVVPTNVTFTNLLVNLVRDDGAVVWLNGKELFRDNMPTNVNPILYNTRAINGISSPDETPFHPFNFSSFTLLPGTNTIAVEIHQNVPDSSDIGFNLELVGTGVVDDAKPAEIKTVYNNGQMTLSWPASNPGYRLYAAGDINDNTWEPVNDGVVVSNGLYQIIIPPNTRMQFYRLAKPQ